jgi:hypothetical protein
MLPWELTVPVQVLFASSTSDGVVLDCTVAEEVVTSSSLRIPSGSPFSLLIDSAADGPDPAGPDRGPDPALVLLERWCSAGVIVEATTSSTSKCLVLSHDEDRVVLEIL